MSPHAHSPAQSDFEAPMRDGVTASQVFLPRLDQPVATVYAYLCQQFAHIKAAEWQQRFAQQLVFDQAGRILEQHSPYVAGQHIYYYRFLAYEVPVPFQEQILFETEDLLVVDKPHFLTMSPTGRYVQETLLVRLKKSYNNPHLTPIHRLDRETAGVVLISKRIASRGAYQQMFAQAQVQKEYHAIAAYDPRFATPQRIALRMQKSDPFYTMRVVEGEPNSETEIYLLEHDQQRHWAKYRLRPKTGKQHQLRVHLAQQNIPIRHDPLYPLIQHKAEDDFSQPLQLLAKSIRFQDPLSQRMLQFDSAQALSI